MFELDQALAEWRRQMIAAGVNSSTVLAELESHLRDETERQMRSGLDPRQAFAAAVHRIGEVGELTREFGKVRAAIEARQRKFAGIIYAFILAIYCGAATYGLWHHELESWPRVLGFAAIVTTVLVAGLAWFLVPRFFPAIASRKINSAVGIIGSISGMVWLFGFVYFILPRLELTQGQLTVVLLWAFLPLMSAPLVFLGIDKTVG